MSAESREADDTSLRIDKWLWFARFFKTRSLAAKAVTAGHVRVNGMRVKPSRAVALGDALNVQRGAELTECNVVALPARRGSATEARQCYLETEESIARRETRALERKSLATALGQPTKGRPDKRTRRMLRERVRGSSEG